MPGDGGYRILFAGGGSGGHVFPGLALAQHPLVRDVFWLCTSRPFDETQLSKENVPHEPLESPRWRGFKGFLGPMARALGAAAGRLRSFRPDVLVGVGGYGTVPPAIAARALGVPFVLLEQNVRPGKANRFLAAAAERIYVQWAEARTAFPGCGARVRVTGSPLRKSLVPLPRDEARRRLGLDPVLPTLAVVGGSQGAEALNRGAVDGLDGTASKLQVLHVAGAGRSEAVREAYRARGARAVVLDFLPEMHYLYSAADLVVSRAGAMAIAELAAFGTPAVLVPIARSSGDHQRENARAAARSGGAILMEERDCAAGGLAPVLRRLVSAEGGFERMREALRPLARPGAADAILGDLGELLKR
jgi:UDP-N-acetylglucosamine--N-acetylmuramyl-(pentapeptide) pyrophosphoryl-undecaprenol N-acetylglucosamine transferase